MKGLILKDIFNILTNIKSIILTIAILSILMLKYINLDIYLTTITTVFNMFILTTMTYDENSNWDQYAISLPVSKKDIVISKYIVMSIFSTVGTLLSVFIVFIFSLFIQSISINRLYVYIPMSMLISLLFCSLILPITFKYGVEKARTLFSLIIIIPILLGYIFFSIFSPFDILYSKSMIAIIIPAVLIILLIIIIFSIRLSIYLYSNKEF